MTDVKEYLEKCQIKARVSSTLDNLLSKNLLPYNPYFQLTQDFTAYSEYFIVAKTHSKTGSKTLQKGQSCRVGVLYKSVESPYVWGLPNVLSLVRVPKLAYTLSTVNELVHISDDSVKYALSIVSPTAFYKSVLGRCDEEIHIHVDLVCQDIALDKAVETFVDVSLEDFVKSSQNVCPLFFDITVNDEMYTYTVDDMQYPDTINFIISLIQTCDLVQSTSILIQDECVTKVTKTFTYFHVWKKLGKLFCSDFGCRPMLNLYRGVIINSDGVDICESILFQSSYIDPTNPTSKEIKKDLSPTHPIVLKNVAEYIETRLSTNPSVDIFRFSEGVMLKCLHDNTLKNSVELLDDVYYLHRSTAAIFYRIAAQYATIELSLKAPLGKEKLSEIATTALMSISKTLNVINLSQVSCTHKWWAQVLENNIDYLETLINDTFDDAYLSRYVNIEKMACGIASLFLLPSTMHNLKALDDMVDAGTIENNKVIKNHMFNLDNYEIITSIIPPPNMDVGFYEPSMNSYVLYSVDVAKNAAKIQSTANMHTIAVLLKYQNDMFIDSTMENIINSISLDLPANPYNYFAFDCLTALYTVNSDCISESELLKLFARKPRLKDQDHQIYSVDNHVFGLRYALLQADMEGLNFVVHVCDSIKNSPLITKKNGVRITPVVVPYPEMLLCGMLCPMMYTVKCEEHYAMIKETKSANQDIAISFLCEILFNHIIEISAVNAVTGYYIDSEELILLDMQLIQTSHSQKNIVISEFENVIKNHSLLSFQFFIKTDFGYVRVIKDIKPIYVDKNNGFEEHMTPVSAFHSLFAVFSKLHPARFFYDYNNVSPEYDVNFVINQLNKSIIDRADCWDVYQTIQLKYIVKEDMSFLPTAFHIAHSPCSRLYGLQQLNTIISDILQHKSINKSKSFIDEEALKVMLIDFVTHTKEILHNLGICIFVRKLIEIHLNKIYQEGKPIFDENLKKPLLDVFNLLGFLFQYFEKELFSCSNYKIKPFVTDALGDMQGEDFD